MTQKELLYLEDAVKHETNMATIFENLANEVEDKNVETFLTKLSEKCQDFESKLLKVMEGLANE